MNTIALEPRLETLGVLKEFVLQEFSNDTVTEFAKNLLVASMQRKAVTYRDVFEICFVEMQQDYIDDDGSPSTLAAFDGAVKKYVLSNGLPYESFGDKLIYEITVYEVKKLKREIKNKMKNRQGDPLSHSRLLKIYMYIDRVFKFAADLGYCTVEFCNEIKIQKIGGSKRSNQQIVRNFFSESEYKLFIKCYDETAKNYFASNLEKCVRNKQNAAIHNEITDFRYVLFKAFFSLIYWTGARVDEARGIKWSYLIEPDGNFKLSRIKLDFQHKEKNAKYIKKKVYTAKPKTDYSIRVCVLSQQCKKDLDALRDYLIAHNLYDHDDYIFKDFFCLSPKPIPASNIDRCFKLVLNKTKIIQHSIKLSGLDRNITMHGMRHSACTYLLERGMDIEDVARYLGHSNTKMVEKVYKHFIDPTQQDNDRLMINMQYFMN